ncbi:MAG TPA: M20/M25/M40 family metallo-hydrolase [Pirellulales bacterium]|nr:M20/M25/M40 family metallo-hydrolase [Pirellulales bacterium]
MFSLCAGRLPADEKSAEAVETEQRLFDAVRYLASDELEGRGVGGKGLDLAAEYIAREFAAIGLATDRIDGGPFQTFTMTTGADLGEPNQLTLVGPPDDKLPEGARLELKLGQDFNPLALGGSGKLDVPLVFVGYGITAKDENYDDYAGIDVKGKAVIVLRHEPQQDNTKSVFNGTLHSPHAPYVRKLANAHEHGAAAVLFCNDEFDIRKNVAQRTKFLIDAVDDLARAKAKFKEIADPTAEQTEALRKELFDIIERIIERNRELKAADDPLLGIRETGGVGEVGRVPVVFCRRSAIEPAVKAVGADLAELEHQIDVAPSPHSRELPGWRLTGEVTINRREVDVKNVVAVLDGEGSHADETIVIGAHYDHLGFGGEGSLAPGQNEIHNGADDNGSGIAALLEVARRLATLGRKLPRRVVFIAFTGEERGLIGSARYCRRPLVPMDQTIAMLNMDMVGRLNEEKLIIQGVDTAPEFGAIIDALNEGYAFKLTKQSGGFGPSDHSSFYAHKVPVMHFFTGTHPDYHRPSDDYDKLNLPGMRRVVEMVTETTVRLAEAEGRPRYQEVKAPAGRGGGDRPYFGSVPDFSQDTPGYALSGVSKDSPAAKAGIKGGDVIIQFGESKIGNLDDFDSALRKYKTGDKVPLVVKRGEDELKLEVVLEPPR